MKWTRGPVDEWHSEPIVTFDRYDLICGVAALAGLALAIYSFYQML